MVSRADAEASSAPAGDNAPPLARYPPHRPERYACPVTRRARIIAALLTTAIVLLALAAPALATSHSGEGWFGETNDVNITNAMFLTIIFFPTIIIILSLIQWRLDKRKHARMDAAKRRAANADWRGGW